MDYEKGTISLTRGIVFKETNQLDPRRHGHPVIILNDIESDGDDFYYLTMSSQIQRINSDTHGRYYLLRKNLVNRLRKDSIVDLQYIYKSDNTRIIATGQVRDELNTIVQSLEQYDNVVRDNDFNEYQGSVPIVV